eukprot:scaffold49194_cov66-Attheya_sp.AAC.1
MVALPLIPDFDVHLAVAACGINDVDLFDGTTAAARMALDMFNDSFHSCMDKTFDEVDQDFKSYSSLTIASSRYNCHQMTADYIHRYKTHLKFSRDQHQGP